MNVASLELCKQLFELSGWRKTDLSWYESYDDASITWTGVMDGANGVFVCSAYDLGYLVRKLPTRVYKWPLGMGRAEDGSYYRFYYNQYSIDNVEAIADTPEDAAAKLAIELFKRSVLKAK